MTVDIYRHDSFATLLKELQQNFPQRKRPLNLSQFSKAMGYNSPRTLGMVLKGSRTPSNEMVFKITKCLNLSNQETRYLSLLQLRVKRARQGLPTDDVEEGINKLKRSSMHFQKLKDAQFAYISEWYYMVVQQVIEAPGFDQKLEKIPPLLKNKISLKEVQKAVEHLVTLGLITRDRVSGRLAAASDDGFTTEFDVPSAALQTHHRQMLARAQEAIDEVPILDRELLSATLRVEANRISEAKRTLRDFCLSFVEQFHSKRAPEVRQINFQFFPHTESK